MYIYRILYVCLVLYIYTYNYYMFRLNTLYMKVAKYDMQYFTASCVEGLVYLLPTSKICTQT